MRAIFRSTKLKIIAVILTVCAISVAAARGTIAFFTDSKENTSVFTAGNVYIELTEAAVRADAAGNLIEDTEAERIKGAEINEHGAVVVNDYGVVFPGQTIHKDPTIKNVGSHKAWVAAKIIIEDGNGDIHRLYKYSDGYDDIDIERLLMGGLFDESVHVGEWNGIPDVCYNDRYAMIQASNHAAGKYEFYFLMLNPLDSGETVELFDTLYINEFFGNSEMQEFRDLKLTVQAFAVQTYGFSSCIEAVSRAFSSHFVSGVGE